MHQPRYISYLQYFFYFFIEASHVMVSLQYQLQPQTVRSWAVLYCSEKPASHSRYLPFLSAVKKTGLELWNYPDLWGPGYTLKNFCWRGPWLKVFMPCHPVPFNTSSFSFLNVKPFLCIQQQPVPQRKRLRCCVWGFRSRMPPLLPPKISPAGVSEAKKRLTRLAYQ